MQNIVLHPGAESEELVNGREHQKYYNAKGDLLPGVTSILGQTLAKPQLIHWAAKLEREEILKCFENSHAYLTHRSLSQILPEKLFYVTKRDSAGDVGTCTHHICQMYVEQKNAAFNGYEKETIEKAYQSFLKFKSFWDSNGYRLVGSEMQLVSERHNFGGTLDCVALDGKDNYTLLDLKTGSGIYGDYISQLAAYEMLYNENHKLPIQKRMIVRLGKEDVDDFEVKEVSDDLLDAHASRFLLALSVYHIDKKIKDLEPKKKRNVKTT